MSMEEPFSCVHLVLSHFEGATTSMANIDSFRSPFSENIGIVLYDKGY